MVESSFCRHPIETQPENGVPNRDAPPEKLTTAFATADVTLTGWRLDRIADDLRDGDLLAVRALPARYANPDKSKWAVASITVGPVVSNSIGKGRGEQPIQTTRTGTNSMPCQLFSSVRLTARREKSISRLAVLPFPNHSLVSWKSTLEFSADFLNGRAPRV